MQISIYQNKNRDAWTKYIAEFPQATFYHRIEWKTVLENTFGHKTFYLIAFSSGEIEGVLPLVFIQSKIFGKIFVSMPFLNYGGMLADKQETKIQLIEEARRLVKEYNADYLELRQLKSNGLDLPTKYHKVSMTVQLENDPDILWQNFTSKHRREIRRSIKNDLQFVTGHKYLDAFYDIISHGWRDLGTPIYRKSFFRSIVDEFKDSVQISLVLYKNIPVATAFDGLDGDTVEGMWTYALREYRHLYTNYFLYWKLIENACLDGFKYFHLGRSTTDTGATFFKNKWNATPKQLYWEYLLNLQQDIPELNVDNPKYRLFINVWRHLPIRVTQTIGPLLSKNIP